MKKTIVILLLTISNAYGQNLNGFMGFPFGTSKNQIKTEFKAKQPSATIYTDEKKTLTFTDAKFGGREAIGIVFAFTDDSKLHTAVVLLEPEFPDKVFTLYDEIITDINTKYHYYDNQNEDWTYPYDKSDKYQHGVTALKLGKLDASTMWKFPTTDGEDNVIQVSITSSAFVKISYQDGNLINQVVSKNKEKSSADY
jgi:hypothetical protein